MAQQFIYWEKQGMDQLCGVHCINSLLQGPFFTEIDLGTIAQDLDKKESELMGGQLINKSHNVGLDGNFSIQVLQEALKIHTQLHLESVDSQLNQNLDLSGEQGFICNSAHHWFAIRKIQGVWYNLNSTNKRAPEIISDFYLSAFLMSVRGNGYHIFVVKGQFPDNSTFINQELQQHQRLLSSQKVRMIHEKRLKKKNYQLNIGGGDDQELQKALKASLGQKVEESDSNSDDYEDDSQQQKEQKQQVQAFSGQGQSIQVHKISSNYDKFNIDPNDAEFYFTIMMTLEEKFKNPIEEGLCILFTLPNGSNIQWTFQYNAIVEDLYDFIFYKSQDKKSQFIMTCPIQKIYLLNMHEQIIDLGIDTMTQIMVQKI